jgi:hypothetical protein
MDFVLSVEQREELGRLAETANEKLVKVGTSSAEQAFGLGCSIGFMPLLILIVVLFVAGIFNLIMALIALVFGGLALAGISTLLSFRARSLAIRRLYLQEVGPEIDHYLSEHSLPRSQFESLAREAISAEAPLRSFFSPTSGDSGGEAI